MKRPTDTRSASGNLPSFLGSEAATGTQGDELGDEAQIDTVLDQEEPAVNLLEDEACYDEVDDDEEAEGYLDDEDVAEENEPVAPPRRNRNSHRRHRQVAAAPGGTLNIVAGVMVTIFGMVAMGMPAAASLVADFLEPQIVVVLGISLLAMGAGKRRASILQQRLQQMEQLRSEANEELRDTLAQLLDDHHPAQPNDSASPDMQQVMLSLQRQDQKINNLTKAIKMYGKPMMEITGQGTELAGNVAQVKTLVEGSAETTRQAIQRIEQQVRSNAKQTDLGDLPDQIGKLEVSLAALGQRVEDTEVRKSLVRLEDASKELRSGLDQLQRGDTVHEATNKLQQRLDTATQGITDGIEKLREGNLNGLESSVREMQREIAGLATAMAQIQVAVKNGASVANQGARTAAPNPGNANPANTSSTPTAAANTSAPAPSNKASGDADSSDTAGYATGKRNTTGKNVLGAIAKLKQMKG